MLNELIEKYRGFGDALILNFEYKSNIELKTKNFSNPHTILLIISCYNWLTDNFETIEITFEDVKGFQFREPVEMVREVLIRNTGENFLLDFFPKMLSVDENGNFILEKDIESPFFVEFKSLQFKVLMSSFTNS